MFVSRTQHTKGYVPHSMLALEMPVCTVVVVAIHHRMAHS